MSEMLSYHDRLKLIKLGQLPKEAVAKSKKAIPKKSQKKIREETEIKAYREKGLTPLDKWFEERRKEMTGKCVLCGGKTEKHNDATYKRSIHHLFDKRKNMFPSVALHPDNFLEVCFYGNSCHTNIHNGTITWELLKDSAEWSIIKEKFTRIYPYIAVEERKNIPAVLLKD